MHQGSAQYPAYSWQQMHQSQQERLTYNTGINNEEQNTDVCHLTAL